MIPYDDVFEQVVTMASPDSESKGVIGYFCKAAIACVEEKLKADVDGGDIRLIMAAAALAYCRYVQSTFVEEAEIASMKAGDVTITKSSSDVIDTAIKYAESTFADACELFADTAFVFSVI